MRAVLLVFGLLCLSYVSSRTVLEAGVFRAEPEEWERIERADSDEAINLIFAVKQQNKDKLEATLLRTSDPRSSDYGKHLSFEQVEKLVAPTPHAVKTVVNWIVSHGVDASDIVHSPNSDFLQVTVPVAMAEEMLKVEYHVFRHSSGKHTLLRVDRPYSVSDHVAEHIDFVSPTVHFPRVRTTKVKATDLIRGSDGLVTPSFLRQLYQVNDFQPAKGTKNVQAIASFLEQYWSPDDLQTFFGMFQNTSKGTTVAQQIGENDASNPGVEAELDVQYIMSVGQGVPTWVYYTAGRAPTNPNNEPFLAWLVNMTSSSSIPLVVSVSYGEDEKSVGMDYASRINTEFQKLGARGTSVMIASGDSGAGGNCTAAGRFSPDFPSGSPWVTAVGGVTGGTAGSTPTGEVTDSISGGGFSDYWARPSWQDAAVKKYIATATGLPPTANWNQSGRGYPDVAAQSENFLVVTFGIPMPVAGTSCASPTFSGVVSLLNEVRLQKSKSSLGFLNPLIYQVAAATANSFNDATEGSNMGCSFDAGFPAAKGWDAATGWGSPNFKILSSAVAQLP